MADKLILEFQAKTDDLDKRLQAIEGSVDKVGKTSKKVATDMTKDLEGVKDVASQISPEFGRAASAMGTLTGGVGKVVTVMKTLRGAIIATGIGGLLVAIGSLVSYFTSTERGAQKLRVAMAAVGAVVNTVKDGFIGLVDAAGFLLRGDLKGAADAAANAFKGMGDRIRENTRAAIELEKRANALKVSERELSVEMSRRRAEINELKLAAEDENKTVSERIQLLRRADALEKTLMAERIKNAEEALDIARQQAELSENSEADLQKLADAEIALNNIREESNQRQRRVVAQINALERQVSAERRKRIEEEAKAAEEAEAKRLKAAEEAAAAREKAEADAAKRREQIAKELAAMQMDIDTQLNQSSEDVMRRQVAAARDMADTRRVIALQGLQNQVLDFEQYEASLLEIDASLKKSLEDAEREHQERLNEIRDRAEREAADKRREALDRQIMEFSMYAQAAISLINTISQAQANASQFEIGVLKEQLEQGLISREEYDMERRKIMRREAMDAKALALLNAIISTAAGIAEALPNIPLSIIAGVLGGVQIGVIASQPIPQFAEGGYVDGKGQLHGRTHRQGGIHIEAEGGEFITKASQAKKYGHIVEAVNKGTIEKLIAETYVRPAVDAAILSGWSDLQRSVEVNAAFNDMNLLRAIDRHRASDKEGFKYLAAELSRNLRHPKRGYA